MSHKPGGAAALAVSMRTLLSEVGFLLIDAVTPVGGTATKYSTPENPFCPFTVMLIVAVPPWGSTAYPGEMLTSALGCGVAETIIPTPVPLCISLLDIGYAASPKLSNPTGVVPSVVIVI
jgi:hypothetical protein